MIPSKKRNLWLLIVMKELLRSSIHTLNQKNDDLAIKKLVLIVQCEKIPKLHNQAVLHRIVQFLHRMYHRKPWKSLRKWCQRPMKRHPVWQTTAGFIYHLILRQFFRRNSPKWADENMVLNDDSLSKSLMKQTQVAHNQLRTSLKLGQAPLTTAIPQSNMFLKKE